MTGGASAALAAVLLAALTALTLWPIAGAVIRGAGAVGEVAAEDWARVLEALAASVAAATGIAALASVLGWPIAWTLGASGPARALAPLLTLPLLLPHTIAYTGWGVLRSPDTWLGDLIVAAAQSGERWLPVLVSRSLAVLGLALWAAPVAALVQSASVARTPRALLELARIESRPGPRRAWALVMMHRGGVLAGMGVVAALMLGSPVPLHLAQLPTHATVIWRELTETAPHAWGRVWAMSLPAAALAVLIAAPATRAFCRGLEARRGDGPVEPYRQAGIAALLGAAAVWTLALAAPTLLLAVTVSHWSVVARFFAVEREAMLTSAGVAAAVAGGTAVITVLAGVALASPRGWRRAVAVGALGGFLVSALVPGIMVGAAMAQGWATTPIVGDHAVIVVLSHLARFGALGLIAAVAIERLEPAALREVRRLEGAEGLGDWLRTSLARRWPVVVAASLAAGCLSLHEIEASIMVRPPGPDNLARFVLDALHFARQDDLAAAVLTLVGAGVVLGLAASAFVAAGINRHGDRARDS